MVATLGAQFLSALADNALLFAALRLVRKLHYPVWSGPLIQSFFVAAYILLAPFVGALADAQPKGRVMAIANVAKFLGAFGMCMHMNPFVCYALVAPGAAANSPAKYGILGELTTRERLLKANSSWRLRPLPAILARRRRRGSADGLEQSRAHSWRYLSATRHRHCPCAFDPPIETGGTDHRILDAISLRDFATQPDH